MPSKRYASNRSTHSSPLARRPHSMHAFRVRRMQAVEVSKPSFSDAIYFWSRVQHFDFHTCEISTFIPVRSSISNSRSSTGGRSLGWVLLASPSTSAYPLKSKVMSEIRNVGYSIFVLRVINVLLRWLVSSRTPQIRGKGHTTGRYTPRRPCVTSNSRVA